LAAIVQDHEQAVPKPSAGRTHVNESAMLEHRVLEYGKPGELISGCSAIGSRKPFANKAGLEQRK
jgi:hypothetical protein